jgi:cytochrome c553
LRQEQTECKRTGHEYDHHSYAINAMNEVKYRPLMRPCRVHSSNSVGDHMKSVLVLSGLIVSAAVAQAQQIPNKPDIAKGQAVAKQVCSACHGEDGNSTSPANPKIAGQIFEYHQKQLTNFKANAERKSVVMLAMVSSLSPADMQNVAAYYAAQKSKGGASGNKETFALGRDIYRGGNASKGLAACAACHGPTGGGMPAQYPRLAGQFAEYTEAQMKSFRTGERANDANKMMRSIAAKMSDDEIRAVSDYIAGLP